MPITIIERRKRELTAELIAAQDQLVHSIGDFDRYFDADRRIRLARRELRKLEQD